MKRFMGVSVSNSALTWIRPLMPWIVFSEKNRFFDVMLVTPKPNKLKSPWMLKPILITFTFPLIIPLELWKLLSTLSPPSLHLLPPLRHQLSPSPTRPVNLVSTPTCLDVLLVDLKNVLYNDWISYIKHRCQDLGVSIPCGFCYMSDVSQPLLGHPAGARCPEILKLPQDSCFHCLVQAPHRQFSDGSCSNATWIQDEGFGLRTFSEASRCNKCGEHRIGVGHCVLDDFVPQIVCSLATRHDWFAKVCSTYHPSSLRSAIGYEAVPLFLLIATCPPKWCDALIRLSGCRPQNTLIFRLT